MEIWRPRQTYTRKARARAGRLCSPVPAAPLALRRGPRKAVRFPMETTQCAKRTQIKRTGGGLPKIIENCLLTEKETNPIHYSANISGATENRSEPSEVSHHVSQISLMPRVESTCSNLENKSDMKHMETTSDMSVPTGVSSYLINCLETASMAESTADSSSVCSPSVLSSPEAMRGADEFSGRSDLMYNLNTQFGHWLKNKNSTLLETSQAVDIDLLPQPSNISEIEDLSSKTEFGGQAKRNKHVIDTCLPPAHISTWISGKSLCKIRPSKEETPAGLKGASPCVPARPIKKPSRFVKRRKSKCKRKVAFLHPAFSASALLEGDELFTASSKLDISPVCMPTLDEELILNTTGPFVCSSEIVAASPTLESRQHTVVPECTVPTAPGSRHFFENQHTMDVAMTACLSSVGLALAFWSGNETRPYHNEGQRWEVRQVIKMDALHRQAAYETRPYHVEVRSWEVYQIIETKKYKYCTLGLYWEEDNKSKPMTPVPWKPRRVPSGVPLDTITL